jgi:hypothetical protein
VGVSFLVLLPLAVGVRRRAGSERRSAVEASSGVAHVAKVPLDELSSQRDVRLAIVLAYARMERDLADVDVVRSTDETSSEFLVRVSRVLRDSSPAAAALTERFETARFSEREPTEADRTSALRSLREIERELGSVRA